MFRKTLAHAAEIATTDLFFVETVIRFARQHAQHSERCRFETGDTRSLSAGISADVMSAASLLFVVPDPASIIQDLWSCMRPGGTLIVIETSELMAPAHVRAVSRTMRIRDRLAPRLWAHAQTAEASSQKFQQRRCQPVLAIAYRCSTGLFRC